MTAWWALALCAGGGCEVVGGIHERSVQPKTSSTASATSGGATNSSASTGGGTTTPIQAVAAFSKGNGGVDSAADATLPDMAAGDVALMVLVVNDVIENVGDPAGLQRLKGVTQTADQKQYTASIWYAHAAAAKEAPKSYHFTTKNQNTYYEYTGVVYRGAKAPLAAITATYDNAPYQPAPLTVFDDHSLAVVGFTRFVDDTAHIKWTLPGWTERFDDGGTAFFDLPADKGTLSIPEGKTPLQMVPLASSMELVLVPL